MSRVFLALGRIPKPWIYGLVFVAAALPFFLKRTFPAQITPEVRAVYEFIESLPEGTPIVISTDYGPSTIPEMQPAFEALLTHAFRKNLRVMVMTHTTYQGLMVAQLSLDRIAKKFHKEYGKDYVLWGFRPGAAAVVVNLGRDIYSVFDTDVKGTPLKDMPVMQGVHSLKDVGLVISLTATSAGDIWVQYGQARYGFPLALGSTAVISPGHYLYYTAGQVIGLIPALKGASEYEVLVGNPTGPANLGMVSQASVHILLIVLIFLGNVGYLAQRHTRRRR